MMKPAFLQAAGFALGSVAKSGLAEGGRREAIIFIDRRHGKWLKVEESGLEWTNSPPAHGYAYASFVLLRRRISPHHR